MSVTHGTESTAGPVPGPVPPEETEATGRPDADPAAMAAVVAAARAALPADCVVDAHIRLRTYECDGLAHYRVTPALVVLPENAQQVAAVVQPRDVMTPDLESVQQHCRTKIAGYKVPRQLHLVEQMQRSPSGKADYPWATKVATGTLTAPA